MPNSVLCLSVSFFPCPIFLNSCYRNIPEGNTYWRMFCYARVFLQSPSWRRETSWFWQAGLISCPKALHNNPSPKAPAVLHHSIFSTPLSKTLVLHPWAALWTVSSKCMIIRKVHSVLGWCRSCLFYWKLYTGHEIDRLLGLVAPVAVSLAESNWILMTVLFHYSKRHTWQH